MPAEMKKELCSENFIEALALGLLDGGCEIVTNYPGFRSNELSDCLGCRITSVDEKNAFAVAWGASLAGKRSVVTMKNVGLNDAADAFLNAMMLGVNGGLVLVVFDDLDLDHSQIRLDSRHYFDFFGGLWLEPSCASRAYEFGYRAFELSEQFSTPVVIRVTNILALKGSRSQRRHALSGTRTYERDPSRWVIHPSNATRQEQSLIIRNSKIQQWVDEQPIQFPDPAGQNPIHISVGGKNFRRGDMKADIELETYPLPRSLIDALSQYKRPIIVHERGSPFVVNKLRSSLSPFSIEFKTKPSVLSNRKYHNSDRCDTLFAAIRSLPDHFVSGDLGTYTMDPYKTIDACLCYGCSVGVATGFSQAAPNIDVICVTGDGAFFHSGKAGVHEAAARGAQLTVIVFDNGGCRGTGGQSIPGDFAFSDPRIEIVNADFVSMTTDDHRRLLLRPFGNKHIRIIIMKDDYR